MMEFYDALNLLLKQVKRQPDIELLDLHRACGRILAADIHARFDSPLFDNSAMDGYAVCGLTEEKWQIIGETSAGSKQNHALQAGQAIHIFTGAALPEHTEAVVPLECVIVHEAEMTVTASIKLYQHIRRQGEELHQGDVILTSGSLLTPQAIGAAAAQGLSQLPCFTQLRTAVFTTGDELVATSDGDLEKNHIFDSNRPMLLSMLQQHKFIQTYDGGILPDDVDRIKDQLHKQALQQDVMIISGGASVGGRDFVKPALEQLGTMEHWRLSIKPGKPFGWGYIENCKVFLLPGNPVASFVTLTLLGMPTLKHLAGMAKNQAWPISYQAQAGFTLSHHRNRREFMRGQVDLTPQGPVVKPLEQQGSHMLSSCVHAQVLIDIPANTAIHEGQWLTIYPI